MVFVKSLITTLKISMVVLVFVLGVLLGSANAPARTNEHPSTPNTIGSLFSKNTASLEVPSPDDYINEGEIHVLSDKVIIDIKNPQWARFTDTNSMDPVLDIGTNAIQIIPEKPEDIHIGDIISYASADSSTNIIHRVVDIGEDNEGIFFILKGDNNAYNDPDPVRFSQVKRKVVALIY